MILKKLTLKNFMCYESASIDFPQEKIVNIYGFDEDRNTSNGVGKSAIKEAILFALFGKTKVSLNELVRKGASSCEVLLICEVQNKVIEIIRKYKRVSTLSIKVNGKEVDLNKIKLKKNYIIELLGMDYDTCINFSIFDAIRFEDLTSLSTTEIKRLLQLLFNYEKFNKSYANLKDQLKTNDNLLLMLKNQKTHYFSTKRLNTVQQYIRKNQNMIRFLDNKLKKATSLTLKITSCISKYNTLVDKNKRFINWIVTKENCPTCTKPLDNKIQILNKYQGEINKYQQIIQKFQKRLQIIENYTRSLQNNINSVNDKLFRASNILNRLLLTQKQTQDIKQVHLKSENLKLMLETMREFESYVMNYYVQYLETLINQYLTQLTDITCTLSFINQGNIVTRNFNKVILKLYRNDKEFQYMSLSSGERMLVAYAFKLAINTLNFKDTFLFIDEGFNRLDKNNRYKLLDMLRESPFRQIFLISHDDVFEDLPKIYITKKSDVSTVVCI